MSKKGYTENCQRIGRESKEVVTRARKIRFDVKSHASSVDTDVAEKLIKELCSEKNSRKESSRSGCQGNGCRRKAAPSKRRATETKSVTPAAKPKS